VPGLVDRAELVVEGRVLAERAYRAANGLVHTEYVLQCDRTFLGADAEQRVVRLPGGVLPDGSGTVIPGLPGLARGEHVVLFLSPENATGVRMPVGLAQGKLVVEAGPDGARSLVRHALDLRLLDPATGRVEEAAPRTASDYDRVVAAIEAAAAARRVREAAATSTGGAR
jgi:hypothetical protein